MPKQQDRSASTAKANSQPDQADASNNAATSKDSEILQAIVKLKAEIQEDSRQNMDKLSQEINGKLEKVCDEINSKLDNIARDIQCLSERVDEAEFRITQLESWAEEVTTAMCTSLEEWKSVQQKITDLESRSRRNNICLFGLSEGEETNPVPLFTDIFLKTHLQIPEDFDLKIQRAHRLLASKPLPRAPPRPVIINFQEYSEKDMVLREAWKRKIKVGSSFIYFDHDYPSEIVKKRKEYTAIKKLLKKKNICFPHTT
ncbi:DNA polymerase delta subunit 4 [Sarotherodon galilaeus]